MAGFLARAAASLYIKTQPPFPWARRNKLYEFFEKYCPTENAGGVSIKVLLVGSSQPESGTKKFGSAIVDQLDIQDHGKNNIICDAECMTEKLSHNQYDFAAAVSLLEHTKHPWKVVSEISKVLKPGGIVYIAAPWVHATHDEPHDFWRISVYGLINLLRDVKMEILESGSLISPHGTMYDILKSYFCEVLSFNNSVIYYILLWIFQWLLLPFGILEWVFKLGRRDVYYTDSMVYVIGRKPEQEE